MPRFWSNWVAEYAVCGIHFISFLKLLILLLENVVIPPAVPPRIQPGPKVMRIQVGHPVELPCVVRGVPKPTLTWTKEGKSYPVSPDGSLALRTVGLDDEGTYTCTATNSAGRDEAQVNLQIQGWLQMCTEFITPVRVNMLWVMYICSFSFLTCDTRYT